MDKNSGGTVTKTTVYYPLAGAMRVNGTLYYVVSTGSTQRLKDHLGSASVVTDASGNVVGEQRYYLAPRRHLRCASTFGETRLATGSMYTDKLFTGQREMAGLGIYHYQSRFYSPKLGRFLSADSIVPNPFNPQDYNRFAYVRNNPVRYVDPSGHEPKYGCYTSVNGVCTNANGSALPADNDRVAASAYRFKTKNKSGGGGGNNSETNSPINDPNWGQNDDRVERAEIVWSAICQSGGWWGSSGCPSEQQLVTWLLYEEGNTLYYRDQVNMARGMRYRFAYFGNTKQSLIVQLSGFTTFLNPDGDGDFDQSDWDALTNSSSDLSGPSSIVADVYSGNIQAADGNYLYWWDGNEIRTDQNQWPGKLGDDYFQTVTVTGLPFYFTGIPNIRNCAMYGNNCR